MGRRTESKYDLPASIDREMVLPATELRERGNLGPCHWIFGRVENPAVNKSRLEGGIRAPLYKNTAVVKKYICEGRAGRREGGLINGSQSPYQVRLRGVKYPTFTEGNKLSLGDTTKDEEAAVQ